MTNPTSNRPGGGDNTSKNFQPERYLERRNGTAYLPLKWRLAWLRADHPQAIVKTNLVSHKKSTAIFKAEISLPEGATATGWGARRDPFATEDSESRGESSLSYLTEAENQALGRALAILGYGMDYTTDFDAPSEGESIPLRESDDAVNEDDSIEVPMNGLAAEDVVGDEEAEEIGGTITTLPSIAALKSAPEPEPEEEPEAEEEDEEEEEAEPTSEERKGFAPPTPLRAAIAEEPARFSTEPTPFRSPRQAPTNINAPTPLSSHPAATRRPGPTPVETPAPPVASGPTPLISAGVEERLKNINDSKLALAIKQIFHEARRLHNLDEDRVDMRSEKRYGVPVNRLSIEQAEEFLEKIKSAVRTPKK